MLNIKENGDVKMETHLIDTPCMTIDQFVEYYNSHNFKGQMFDKDGKFNRNYNNYKKTGLIAKIFEDHWEDYYLLNKDKVDKYRPNADYEINKVIDCFNQNLGGSVYCCPKCNELVFISHTCKSRLCSSCGYKYKLERVENILQKVYKCNHRQIVFTIPEELRPYFFYPYEERINIFYDAVNLTIDSMLNESYKKGKSNKKKRYKKRIKYTPGFICFLHTFGRSMIWNPHIHVLLAEIKLGSDNTCKKLDYLNYDALSKRFQYFLLTLLQEKLGPSFSKNYFFNKYKKGFYVYAEPKKFKNIQNGIEYVARYCGRVPISENRIINYDGENVTYCYNDHKDDSYHEITVSAFKFIEIILRHLIPSDFKTIRYYGFYAQKHPIHDKIVMLINDEKRKKMRKELLSHKLSVLLYFNSDPYSCPFCETLLNFAFVIT